MNEKIFVKPKAGLKVQKNIADLGRIEYISENGENVPNTLYYRRLISRGELVKTVTATKKKTSKSEA